MHTALALLAFVAGCAAAEADAVAPMAPDGPVTLTEAVARGLVTLDARGGGTSHIALTLRARVDFDVTIPAGTYFAAKANVQNMVVTESASLRLRADTAVEVTLESACASYHRSVPHASDGFELGTPPPKLAALVTCLEERDVPDSRRQLLVWNITDGVDRGDLARNPAHIRPFLLEACTRRLHGSPQRCAKIVDAAFDLALERWLAKEHDAERACLRISAGAS